MKRIVTVVATALIVSACSSTAVDDIAVGDCFDDPETQEVAALDLIDCAEPHDNEVYAEVLMEGASYPGDAAVADFAAQACFDPFEAYVGESYADSPLDYIYLVPTQESWDAGDRSALCLLYSVDLSKLTGSMEK